MITPNSDYRYLEGIVRGDSMFLSTFDGAHSYLFTAKIETDSRLAAAIIMPVTGRRTIQRREK
jgi:hypothetical protein